MHSVFNKTIVSLVMILVCTVSYSLNQHFACPSRKALRMEGVSMAEQIDAEYFVTMQQSRYGTNHNWLFTLSPIKGKTADEAMSRANTILNLLTENGIPQIDEATGMRFCSYDTATPGQKAIALRDAY